MEGQPKVSVIIPVYNAEEYLKQLLESILRQSLTEIEVICVDDGSTDESAKIIQNYCNIDSRVRIICQENQFAGVARNAGLSVAKGEYIHFMDADDWVEKDAYEEWYSIAKDQDADVCIGGHTNYDVLNKKKTRKDCSPSKNYVYSCTFEKHVESFIYAGVVPWNKIYRRRFLEENNIKFDTLFCANDRSFYYNVITHAKNITFIRKSFVNYRQNVPGALTGAARLQHFDCHFASFKLVWKLFEKYDDSIKAMVLDSSLRDMFSFYHKSFGTEYEQDVRKQLKCFLEQMDFSVLGENIDQYRWYTEYLLVTHIDSEKTDIYRFLEKEYDQLRRSREDLKKQKEKITRERDLNLKERKKYESRLNSVLHSVSFRSGRVLTFPLRKIRGCIRHLKKEGITYTVRYAKWLFVDNIPSMCMKTKSKSQFLGWGLNTIERNPRIIVSLTSYPARIALVHKGITTLLQQTMKPDKVILWLAREQFPNGIKDLPKELLMLQKSGLTISWCNDIRSYKKLIPALKEYPEDIIVTADDDAYYPKNWLELLYASCITEQNTFIHCHRITRIYKVDDEWRNISAGKFPYPQPTYLHKLVGLGGVLYPPHVLHEDVLDENKFMTLAPTNDDIWFWLMAVLAGTRIVSIPNANPIPKTIEGTQGHESLTLINDHGQKLFWKDFYAILNAYPQINEKLENEYVLMHNIERVMCMPEQDWSSNSEINPELCPYQLMNWYRKHKGCFLDLENPRDFNSKIQWLKLFDSTPLKTQLADKYLVRDWVAKKIGEKYLIPLLGVWDSFDEIKFSELPNQFVLKANHASGYNIIVKDKLDLNVEEAKEKFDTWMQRDFLWSYELHYMNIPKKIIAEKYMADFEGDIYDYRFFCFNGKPEYIWVDVGSGTDHHKRNIYDMAWNLQDYKVNYPQFDHEVAKPETLDEMIKCASVLSEGFAFVRVDFYSVNGNVYFGEMTFTPQGGTGKWEDNAQNMLYGSLITLPDKSPIPTRKAQ